MRLAWVATCLEAETNGRMIDATGLGIDTFWVIDCPAPVRCFLLLNFKGAESEFVSGASYPVEVQLVSDGMTTFDDLSFEFEPSGVPVDHEPGWELIETVPVGVNFIAEIPGGYCLDIWFNGEHYPHSPYFMVRVGFPPGLTA